jgi:sugar O-acyltransferase (sialic acid O-acetyltransferase NeuD family)
VKNVVLFGTGQIAELAHYYFTKDTEYQVAAFTVDAEYISSDLFFGLPVIAFETLEQHFPPESNHLFVAVSYAKMNRVRAEKCRQGRAKNYTLTSYISSRACIFDNVVHGDNCFILEDNTIQPFVKIGDNCTLWSGNHIGHHSVIEDDCFISSHVVISGGVTVGKGCFLGVNSTLRDHITLGEETLIGAGTLILHSTDPRSVYVGTKTEARTISSDRIAKM